jgi:hypothetical protein
MSGISVSSAGSIKGVFGTVSNKFSSAIVDISHTLVSFLDSIYQQTGDSRRKNFSLHACAC